MSQNILRDELKAAYERDRKAWNDIILLVPVKELSDYNQRKLTSAISSMAEFSSLFMMACADDFHAVAAAPDMIFPEEE